MGRTKRNQDLQAVVCIAYLLIERLDNLKVSTPEMIKYRGDLIAMSEYITNASADTDIMQKSTYFPELTKKIDTLVRKTFQDV